MLPLTKRQKQILDYIAAFTEKNGIAPTYREIMKQLRLSSVATVALHLKALGRKGHIVLYKKMARGIKLLHSHNYIPLEHLQRGPVSVRLPLLGLIAAGEPIEAIEDRETIAVPADLLQSENSFVLRVKGESMVEDGILDGDYVVVERSFYPKNGDVVVALLDNTYATLKRYYREATRIRLQPASKHMKPIYTKNPTIQGIVRGIYRKFKG